MPAKRHADRAQPPEDRVSQLEEENRDLRRRIATSSFEPTVQSSDASLDDSPQEVSGHSAQTEVLRRKSFAEHTTKPNTQLRSLSTLQQPSIPINSPYMGLTSASILEGTPETFTSQRHRLYTFRRGASPEKLEDSSKRLEAEAAQQRE